MHRFLKVLLLTISISLPMFAQDAEPNEIQEARKALRDYEQAGKARRAKELISAGLLVREHESGRNIAEAGELSKARGVLRENEKRMAEERERAIDDIPVLVVVHRDSRYNIGRVFNVANQEVIRRRIAEAKADIERNAERFTKRSREALPRLEKALQDLKETGKPLGGMYATVFEADDKFVVAYFDSMSIDHFVCLVSKKDYAPLPTVEAKTWIASNLSQKGLIVE